MLDNTIITKFELSEREKMLKKQFFKREEEPGKKYLFSRPEEKINDSNINKSNYMNNTQSISLEQNQNSKIFNIFDKINNTNNNEKIINNNIKESEQNINQNLANSVPDIKNITQEDMNKFYEEAANYLPKMNGGMTQDQINLLMNQNKIMQRNVDALQETNRSLQDFIIYTLKKDSNKNQIQNETNSQQQKIQYDKLNKLLAPLYNHIDNLQSQIKELNQKKREDEINVELDDLIIKNQKKYKNNPQSQPKSRLTEEEKNNKMMMKTLTTLKGTMSNMTEQMKKIGNNFNEKIQKVLEDTEKNKLKSIVGGRANSTINNSKIGLGSKNIHNQQSNNISIIRENGGNQNESILKNKLEFIDYESFKSDLIDIGHIKDELESEYKSGAPEFQKLTKPKTKIKFSYNLDKDLNNITDKINNRNKSKPKISTNLNKNETINKPSMKEKVSNNINKEKRPKSSKIYSNKKSDKKKDNKYKNMNNINNKNEINEEEEVDYENKMNNLNKISVVDKMNLFKEKMSRLSGNYEVKENNENNKKLNQFDNNNKNDLDSNHSGVTNLVFNKPSINQNKNKYNPPKVKYKVFHGQKGIPVFNQNLDENEQPKVIIPEIVLPEPNKLNNDIKDAIDNYLKAAFQNLKPSEAPKIDINKEEKKIAPQNYVQRVIEKEYIIKKKEAPQPVIINQPPQQNQGQNNELLEKFLNLAERFTNLEEKISNQKIEEKKYLEKKIEMIEKKEKIEKIEKKSEPQEKKIILPDTDLISKLVMDKIKKQMNIDINLGKKKNQPQTQKKEKIQPEPLEEKKEEKIDIFNNYQNINIEELDEKIRMPHKINLDEYEVSQTNSYIGESFQKNNLYSNINNQINISKTNININENYNSNEENLIRNNENLENSKSEGQITDNDNSSEENLEQNYGFKNNKNYRGIDLKKIKDLNEQIPNQINILQGNKFESNNNNNIVNIAQISQNNNYNDYLNYLNNNTNNINNTNIPVKNLNPFNDNNINMEGVSNDNFFNDSGEEH